MRAVTKTVYVAEDGREFDTSGECIFHERRTVLQDHLDNHPDIDWRDPCTATVSRVVVGEFVLIQHEAAAKAAKGLGDVAAFLLGFVGDNGDNGEEARKGLQTLDTLQDILRTA